MEKKLILINTDFSIHSFKGGFDNNFSYLLTCMRTGKEIIVDAAIRLETIKPFIKSSPSAILVTHTHKDHIEYINTYIENFPEIKIIGHPESIDIFDKNRFISVSDNSLIKIGNLQLKVIYTPGHYFDSICYFVENVLFTGDTLFVGRTGRTVSQNSDVNDLYDSIYNKILRLPPDTYIYPGHDYGETPSITIEKNIKISKLLQAKNKKEFIKRMADYEKNRKIGS